MAGITLDLLLHRTGVYRRSTYMGGDVSWICIFTLKYLNDFSKPKAVSF